MKNADRELLALLVHEVRSPTAALAAIATALSDDGLDDDTVTDLIALALAASKGIERVVSDAAPGSLELEDVDVVSLAGAAVASAVLSGGHVRTALGASSLVVRGDPIRIRQAIDNLIANAVVHAPQGSEVVVGAELVRGAVRISVKDAGAGIPEEKHAAIFDPGVRLDRQAPGSGLGLAVARAIAEAHGGTLSVRSSPGEGATFVLSLPSELSTSQQE
jgi:signal transduction histidine kinase